MPGLSHGYRDGTTERMDATLPRCLWAVSEARLAATDVRPPTQTDQCGVNDDMRLDEKRGGEALGGGGNQEEEG